MQNVKIKDLYSDGVIFDRWGPPSSTDQSADAKATEWLRKLTKPGGLATKLNCKVIPSNSPKVCRNDAFAFTTWPLLWYAVGFIV